MLFTLSVAGEKPFQKRACLERADAGPLPERNVLPANALSRKGFAKNDMLGGHQPRRLRTVLAERPVLILPDSAHSHAAMYGETERCQRWSGELAR